ncbi:MAG: RNA 3'-terminal phosphate cyclase [Candidatus Bathyarchaeia archaeon]
MMEIRGDMLEGGGQILRISTAISALLRKPVKIVNIRAKRSPPGLRPQHLNAVKAVGLMSRAEINGLNVGSREITFTPSSHPSGSFRIDVGTAGSISLVLQALMPVAAFSKGDVLIEISGGTNNPRAPTIEYFQNILLPILSRMGYRGSIELVRRGFYPRGGGLVKAHVNPVRMLRPIILEDFGSVLKVWGISYSCRLPSHITDRMAKSAQRLLSKEGFDADIKTECLQEGDIKCSLDPGCGIILFSSLSSGGLLGADALGRIGRPAEKVGEEAASNLLRPLRNQSPVEKHLGDQLIIYASLARGESRIKVEELTLHTVTCIELCKLLLNVKFEVEGEVGEPARIVCEGSGIVNSEFP